MKKKLAQKTSKNIKAKSKSSDKQKTKTTAAKKTITVGAMKPSVSSRPSGPKKSLKKTGFGGVTVVKAGSSLAALLLSENDTYAAY